MHDLLLILFITLQVHIVDKVVHVLLLLRIDYCNVLYVGLPLKLQLVQNAVAEVLTEVGHRDEIILPIYFPAQFKVLVLIIKAQHGLEPTCLKDHLFS